MNKKSNIIMVSVLAGAIILSAGWWTVSASKGSDKTQNQTPSRIQVNNQTPKEQGTVVESVSSSTIGGSVRYVASKNGSKYFPETCSSSKTIKEANKIYFNTPEEAQKAGYELAKNCKN